MTLSQLVFRSMKKNAKHYYLYFFALIFSVTLYFSFITLQFNESVLEASSGVSATAGFKAASYMLIFIVTFFVLYANHLFMKRRSKEIGLYQLIGMTKGLVVRLLAFENIVLWGLAISIGIALGFMSSRLFAMILMNLVESNVVIDLTFSLEAFQRTLIVFTLLLIIILVQTAWMIRSVTLLTLFTANKQADSRVKPFSWFQMAMGIIGLALIIYGYYASTSLFDIKKATANTLMIDMLVILGTTIGGTFLVFRFSVSFLLNIVRKRKGGHLSISDVLALTPIMHRMKGNAKSLTLITVLTGVALGILSLSYITYYSAEANAKQAVPFDYILLNNQGNSFIEALHEEGIEVEQTDLDVRMIQFHVEDMIASEYLDSPFLNLEGETPVISESDFKKVFPKSALKEGEGYVTGYSNVLSALLPLEEGHHVRIESSKSEGTVYVKEVKENAVLSNLITRTAPVIVLEDKLFESVTVSNESESPWYAQKGITLKNKGDLDRAEELYKASGVRTIRVIDEASVEKQGEFSEYNQFSQEEERVSRVEQMGAVIFVTGFLGLAFLLATGSILYFKQMSEAEEERESYMILRKIGYSTSDLMKGIYMKQVFNFGVPLLLGLAHSYFAVKSGWMFFGTELVAPLVITMSIYIVLYSIFALLTVGYYKKVVNGSL